jgi:hypothetical protein
MKDREFHVLDLANAAIEAEQSIAKAIIEESRTESEWQLLTAGLTALVSLILPLVKGPVDQAAWSCLARLSGAFVL